MQALGDGLFNDHLILKVPIDFMGRFRLVEQIGAGGFGVVWRAVDKDLVRDVAIKISYDHRRGRDDDKKFLPEARTAASVRHPNIATVHEIRDKDPAPYIVSEYVEGEVLDRWVSINSIDARTAATLIATVSDAIDYAHEQGVLHRDLKPSNILIDRAGTPLVPDFGLARRESVDETMTVEGQLIGTPA